MSNATVEEAYVLKAGEIGWLAELKAIKTRLSGKEIALLAVKCDRTGETLRRYFAGDGNDEDFGCALVRLCSAFLELRDDYQRAVEELKFV